MIVASEFTRWPGGVAIIDNVEYAAELCDPAKDDPDVQEQTQGIGNDDLFYTHMFFILGANRYSLHIQLHR